MASVRGMTPEAILALIKRELANVKLSEDQIRDLIQTNTDIVESIVDLEDKVKAGLTGEALDNLNLELERLKSELQTQASALARADVTLQENSEALIENQTKMAELSGLMSEGYLNSDKIKPGTILGEHIAAQTVSALNIAAGAIVSEKIATGSITADHIVAESITGDRLVARSVGADRLMADSITSNEISSGAITAKELAAGSVTAENIDAAGISADLITAGSLSATRVELAGNDLASQMDFILSQLDKNFEDLNANVIQTRDEIYDFLFETKFESDYGLLQFPTGDMKHDGLFSFMAWVNRSKTRYAHDGRLSHLGLRVTTIDPSESSPNRFWYINFPDEFEGLIQYYKSGNLVHQAVKPYGTPWKFSILGTWDTMAWFAQITENVVSRIQHKFNENGSFDRFDAAGSYISPYEVNISDSAYVLGFNEFFKNLTVKMLEPALAPANGSSGGISSKKLFYTNGTHTVERYDASGVPGYFPPILEDEIGRETFSITVSGRARVRYPKRSDYYGFLLFHNGAYKALIATSGVGTLTGGSLSFSHEDINFSSVVKGTFKEGDKIVLAPVALHTTGKGINTPRFMNVDLTVTLV